jgi:hypothetical protein
VGAPEQRRFILPGIYLLVFLVSLVAVLLMMAYRLIRVQAG